MPGLEPGPVNDSVLLTDRESETTGTAGGKHLIQHVQLTLLTHAGAGRLADYY